MRRFLCGWPLAFRSTLLLAGASVLVFLPMAVRSALTCKVGDKESCGAEILAPQTSTCPADCPLFERHTEAAHGDVCRCKAGAPSHWECPRTCARTSHGQPPYCVEPRQSDHPCRVSAGVCPDDFPYLERHYAEDSHGDVCRHHSGNGAWACPVQCVHTPTYWPPFCEESALVHARGSACRVPPDPGARPFTCDPHGGERGVCIKAEGQGEYADASCDGKCGAAGGGGPAAPMRCKSDWDCSLAGVCLRSGECKCDPWASGRDCSYLNFMPVDRTRLGYLDPEHTSWGGKALLGRDGQWHMFVAEIRCGREFPPSATRCGLWNWKTTSQVAHVVSSHVDGPYKRRSLVLPEMHHNPAVHTFGDAAASHSTWWLYTISGASGPITVTSSDDQGETWSPEVEVAPHENPGPILHSNGSMTLLYRSDYPDLPAPTCSIESIMSYQCDGPKGKCRGGGRPVFNHTGEDPSVFVDHRGYWHMLLNALPYKCVPKLQQGAHAWSRDGVTWSEPRVGAFNTTVEFTDGGSMTCARRERPQMVMDPSTGRPLALVSAVTNCPKEAVGPPFRGGDDSFTLVQRMQQGSEGMYL